MALEQTLLIILLCGMLVVFLLDRFRMEVVAVSGLALGVLLALVQPANVFSGFANPAFITVVEILLIVKVLSRTGLLEQMAERIVALHLRPTALLSLMCGVTATLSVFMNNIGALALMIPVVFSVCRASHLNPQLGLMPIAFAALLGGMCSVVGTPANLIVGQQLEAATGRGLAFFDFAYAGLPTALAGLLAICIWAPRVLPMSGESSEEPSSPSRSIFTEVEVPQNSSLADKPLAELPFIVHSVARAGQRLFMPRVATMAPGDRVLAEIDHMELSRLIEHGALRHRSASPGTLARQAVVMPESTVVGSRIGMLEQLSSRGIVVRAVALQSPRIEGTLDDLQLSIGDVLYLEGDAQERREALDDTEMLALESLGPDPRGPADWRPLGVFLGGVALAAFGFASPQLAFGAVVVGLALAGWLNLREGLSELPWPVLLMLAAMIPIGEAVETTGTARVIADGLLSILPAGDVTLVGAMLALAVIITPFVNNASTAIVLGPIAIGLANAAGLPPEPFLLAIALGVSLDFLTPFGHHNNMIVMSLGGYRFTDFIRLGTPVTLAAALIGVVALISFWL
ncbi:cation transporter [Chelativorans sp. ZYF759]|uniref:SLC13 family permease n=1 Tax=Chelativorans sp. ZYF759 TaxID=2692213 RepID=UPI00145EC5C3|nr:SLC13 family permease [Chelativorans sp. ZYF759]NMG39722.1 cation transporter [Chelativorans sp. ZYF759]